MSELLQVSIQDIAISRHRGYIYMIYACGLDFSVLYVGQTVVREGALGRLSQHLGDGNANTFRQRLQEYSSQAILQNVEFATIPLSQRQEFQCKGTAHREAVEYLVQDYINPYQKEMKIALISTVRKNGYCDIAFIEQEASSIAEKLLKWLRPLVVRESQPLPAESR